VPGPQAHPPYVLARGVPTGRFFAAAPSSADLDAEARRRRARAAVLDGCEEDEIEDDDGGRAPPSPPARVGPRDARRHVCRVCLKRFTRPSSLQIHLHSHTGDKRALSPLRPSRTPSTDEHQRSSARTPRAAGCSA
jgi:uncharacterized Zn-finger protein